MKKTLLSTAVLLTTAAIAQNVNIPDANFKAYLVGNTAINTNADTEIQVSEAQAFTGSISCPGQSITDLTGIEEFINLTYLYCNDNQLTSLDVSQNTALEILWCNQNQLTSLDVTANTALTVFRCYNNQLTSIDVSQNVLLTNLICSYNPLTNLDLTQNLLLEDIQCGNTALTSLDVSVNTSLTSVSCHTGQLTSLNVANGNNTNFTNFASISNPNLFCIEVDDAAYSTANWTTVDASSFFSEDCANCTVYIPDANFKAYLVGEATINTNGDGEIQCTEAHAYSGGINIYGQVISDLTGLEAFTSLTELNCSFVSGLSAINVSQNISLLELNCRGLSLTTLDVSLNSNLTKLQCGANQLTSIDISQNLALDYLECAGNQLTSLDVSSNTNLSSLYCHQNLFTSIDVSNNTALTHFNCNQNSLTSLDISQNTLLKYFYCNNNAITGLDINQNTSLEVLKCNDNQISSLDLSQNSSLRQLECTYNSLTSLDLSSNSNLTDVQCMWNQILSIDVGNCLMLEDLRCYDNQLSQLNLNNNDSLRVLSCHNNSIQILDLSYNGILESVNCYNNDLVYCNIANGNNSNIGVNAFRGYDNPNLTCVQVSDTAHANANWSIDATAEFSLSCDQTIMNIGKEEFESIKLYPNPATDQFFVSTKDEMESVTVLSLDGAMIIRTNESNIDISSLSTGVYLVEVKTDSGSNIQKLIKQ